MSKSPEREVTL